MVRIGNSTYRIAWNRVRIMRNVVLCAIAAYCIFERPRALKHADLQPADLSKLPRRVPRPMEHFKKLEAWFYEEYHDFAYRSGNMRHKVALVTGGSSGIGKMVAQDLMQRGCTVVITARSLGRATAAADWMMQQCKDDSDGTCGAVIPMALELSDLDDVRRFAADFLTQHKRLNYLSENAGMGPTKYGWKGPWASPQGFEYLYASNYLGHFLLLNLLLPLMKDSTDPRVAATSSIAHWVHSSNLTSLLPSEQIGSSEHFGHLQSWRQYGNTKLLQILMCFELQRRLAPTGGKITATPVAPGYISTAISKPALDRRDGVDHWLPMALTPEHGMLTTLHALLSPSHRGETGVFLQPYYSPKHQDTPYLFGGAIPMLYEGLGQRRSWALHRWTPHPDAFDAAFAAELWDASAKAVGIDGNVGAKTCDADGKV